MEKLRNKMDNMELDKVSGGKLPIGGGHKITMEANVDETQMKLPVAGGHKINV